LFTGNVRVQLMTEICVTLSMLEYSPFTLA